MTCPERTPSNTYNCRQQTRVGFCPECEARIVLCERCGWTIHQPRSEAAKITRSQKR